MGASLGLAAAGTAANIIGGNQAADAISGAAGNANALQQQMYDQARNDLSPWSNVGAQALGMLASVYGFNPAQGYGSPQGAAPPVMANAINPIGTQREDVIGGGPRGEGGPAAPMGAPNYDAFFQSPDYLFRVQQGTNALDRSAAARGRLYSGAQLRAVTDYGQRAGSQEYGNWFNRLSGLSNSGQNAAAQVGQFGQNYANQAGQNMLAAGNAQASSYMNTANALSGFGSDLSYGLGRRRQVPPNG